ncbi:unnamed protein product [Caenorhabditis brenneri]
MRAVSFLPSLCTPKFNLVSDPAELKAVEAKERNVAEVVLALKLSVNKVQGKLEFASANVKEMKESIRSQDIAHVAKEVSMILEIKAQEQEDKDKEYKEFDISHEETKTRRQGIQKLEGNTQQKEHHSPWVAIPGLIQVYLLQLDLLLQLEWFKQLSLLFHKNH